MAAIVTNDFLMIFSYSAMIFPFFIRCQREIRVRVDSIQI